MNPKYILPASYLAITLLTSPGVIFGTDEGMKAYKAGQYEQAVDFYQQLLEEDERPEVAFNLGNSLYKVDKPKEAVHAFEQALGSDNPVKKAQAMYNLGNALVKTEKLKEASAFYRRALELMPGDMDAKYNLELVNRMLQQQQQKEDKQPPEPSEYAKKLRKQAGKLNASGKFQEAYQLMMEGLRQDKTVAYYQNFIQKTQRVAQIKQQ